MPAYNVAEYIGQTIESVLLQSYTNWELIIVDDGSTDTTYKVVQSYASDDKRIRFFYQKNGGQGMARNYALQQAKGDFIAFLDADDLWDSEKLEVQINQLSTLPEVDVVFSSGYVFQSTKSNIIREFNSKNNKLYNGKEDIEEFIRGNKVPILTVLARRKALEAVGFFDESRYLQNVEDYHLWFKLLYKGFKLKSYDLKLAYYRVHDKQSTHNRFRNVLKEINLLLSVIPPDDVELKALFYQEILRKYKSLFIKNWSVKEKQELYGHYVRHINISDKLLFKPIMFLLPARIFSFYYRRIHLHFISNIKTTL